MLVRKIITSILVTAFSGQPLLMAAGRSAIGQIITSSGATLDGLAIPVSGTIASGDALKTAKGGGALLSFSPENQANILEDTAVTFRSVGGQIWAQLLSGGLGAKSLGRNVLAVETPKYRVEPREQGKAVYVVALLADKTTLVAARSGDVAITEIASNQNYVLPEGRYALIPGLSSGVPRDRQGGIYKAAQSAHGKIDEPWHIGSLTHDASVALVVGAAVAAVAVPLAVRDGSPASASAP